MLRQIRVAVVGMPDSGKSTLINGIIKHLTGRSVSVDTLMNEVHWSDGKDPSGNPDTRTIKCAKIIFKYKDVEMCFFDCPGHLEYASQISQGITGSCFVIKITDRNRRDDSFSYISLIDTRGKDGVILQSHSLVNGFPFYDTERKNFGLVVDQLLEYIYSRHVSDAVDIESEAISLIKESIDPMKKNAMFFSGGKDSLVGMDLLNRCGALGHVEVYYPYSGRDFPEVEQMVEGYASIYGVKINRFDNSLGASYEKDGSFTMLSNKAKANEQLIRSVGIDMVCIQYRASDEGVRSKDYHISQRGGHIRFSPVFYFSESNIWRYIRERGLPVCSLYLDGYRSLGDRDVTDRCMPKMDTIDEIIEWIDTNTTTTERDGRNKQDHSLPFAMERLRNEGFF